MRTDPKVSPLVQSHHLNLYEGPDGVSQFLSIRSVKIGRNRTMEYYQKISCLSHALRYVELVIETPEIVTPHQDLHINWDDGI